jgi:hypothetical protein
MYVVAHKAKAPFTGQTPKIGHFLQPTAMAIGQRVIFALLIALFVGVIDGQR